MTKQGAAADDTRVWYAVTIAALLCLLPLAWVQYRWIDQISQAERDRMKAHLDESLARFSQDFDSELRNVIRTMVARPFSASDDELAGLAARYARLSESGADDRLIRNLYVARGGERGLDQILRLDRAQLSFLPAEWPPELSELRSILRSPASAMENQMGLPMMEARFPLVFAHRLQAPRPGGMEPFPRRRMRMGPMRSPEGWLIIELDLNYIQTDLLPRLVRRHLGTPNGIEYAVRVVTAAPPEKVIYASDPRLPTSAFDPPDGRAELLRMRLAGPRFGGGFRGGGRPPWDIGELRSGWIVQAKHRAGSLEIVVAKTRWRNLAISLAVLVILVVSLVILLLSTRRAQRLARLQMEFVAGVSHELRTPLSVICAAGDNLADGVVASEQQIRRYGSVIRGEGRRLSRMVDRILGFAGIQSGRTKYDFLPVDVGEVIDRTLAACEVEIQTSGCDVEKHIAPSLPRVLADSTALAHCLRNLLDNAATHGAGGKWIGISANAFPSGNGGEVEIRVEDHGKGIDPADLSHIFEAFYRGRQDVGGQVRGFGIGLALARSIVEAHSGKLTVESAPGAGTCFRMRLPALPEVLAAAGEATVPEEELSGTENTAS